MAVTEGLLNNIWMAVPILLRVSGMFLVAPVFGSHFIPPPVKALVILATTVALFPVVTGAAGGPPAPGLAGAAKAAAGGAGGPNIGNMLALGAGELAVGLLIGFAALLAFVGIQVAGQFLDIELGFGIVNVIDPQLNQVSPLIGNFKYLLALLIFLAVNGHFALIAALAKSFSLVPVGGPALGTLASAMVLGHIVKLFAGVFITAVKVAAPVLASLFLASVALGLLSRAVPQLNIFMIGLPAKALLGMVLMAMLLPAYLTLLKTMLGGMGSSLFRLLEVMGTR
jgi:flagellar biosynthetic protein FliR